MAAPILRRYAVVAGTTDTTVVPAPATGRAFVLSKVTVATNVGPGGVATLFTLLIGGLAVAQNMSLSPGEVYTESGFVIPAGISFTVQAGTANTLSVQAFGEEVDA